VHGNAHIRPGLDQRGVVRRAPDATALIDPIHAELDGETHFASNGAETGIDSRATANENHDVPAVSLDQASEDSPRKTVALPEAIASD
jgi:hypothetical protein